METSHWWVARGPGFQSWVSSSLQKATFCKLFKLPSPWSPHLPSRCENTSCFGRSGVVPLCISATHSVSQGLGFLALCLWLRGTKLVWFGVANGSVRVDLPSLVSYLTSSLYFLLLTSMSRSPLTSPLHLFSRLGPSLGWGCFHFPSVESVSLHSEALAASTCPPCVHSFWAVQCVAFVCFRTPGAAR